MAERPTIDVDHRSRDFHARRHDCWAELRETPVAYNTRHGGFWVVSGYEEVAAVARDAETFSSRHCPEVEDGIEYLGIAGIPRPHAIPTSGIAEVEGDLHRALRRALNPHLVPAAVARLQPAIEATVTWFLDERIESGSMDLVLDLTSPVPAITTLQLLGLPAGSWRRYAEAFHGVVAYRPRTPEFDQALAHIPLMLDELRQVVRDRRRNAGGRPDDLLSGLLEVTLEDGQPLTDDQLVAVLWNLVGGGLDTTGSLTSLTLRHLDQHRALRRRLIDEPDLLEVATDEFLRYFSVNETLTRTVTRDVELGGQQLQRGDHLLLSWLSANRDERTFEQPDDVVLDRPVNPHLAFGVGPHRCIGSHMARSLFQAMVGQVLRRIPDYAVDHDRTELYHGNPELNGVVRMPATFTPGPRTGPPDRPF